MRTRLTDLLDIEHPVMLAGMGGVSYHRLVAAVSEAGGIGTFGASTMAPDELPREIAALKELTDKPFGVDLLTALPGQVEAGIQSVIDGGARIFVAGLGVPREVIELLHSKNVLVGSMCGKVRHAIGAAASGCDFVVAQGTEAGGHTGTIATMALVPQIVDAPSVPIPPASLTAATRRWYETPPMPANSTGCSMPSVSVRRVRMGAAYART